MRRIGTGLAAGCLLVLLAGCATHAISGDGGRRVQVFQGPVAIHGDDLDVTIQRGSDVPKLSILGDSIRVTVEEGAVVRKIEVAGDENVVTIPPGTAVIYTEIGDDNELRNP